MLSNASYDEYFVEAKSKQNANIRKTSISQKAQHYENRFHIVFGMEIYSHIVSFEYASFCYFQAK